MTAAAIPARQLTCLLADTASGIPADTAAVELLARHDHFLHLPEFRRLIAAGSAIGSGEPVAVIRWRATIHALDRGLLPCSRTQAAVLRIAASIGDDTVGVNLRSLLGGLDQRNITLITHAITRANG
jgi:hypothetical protein